MSAAISFSAVDRSFGPVRAIRHVDLEVPFGSVTVLVGPNGAGKTTLVRLATGAIRPDRGTIRVFGRDPGSDGEEIRGRTGVVSPKPALYDRLTGRENLKYAAALYDLADPAAVIEREASRFGIGRALDLPVAGYSTGMRTRLALARSMLHEPELLLLDEPTAGLDPESARAVLELIIETSTMGRTVVMCTHLLHEAEGLADQVVAMDEGSVWAAGSPGDLAERYWDRNVVRFEAEDPESLSILADFDGVEQVHLDGHAAVRLVNLSLLPDVVASLVAAGVRLTRVDPEQPTLERLYFEMRRRER